MAVQTGLIAPTGPETGGVHHHPEIDWEAAASSPEFAELSRRRRRFVVPATAFFLAWYCGFVVLCGCAPDFMGERIHQGFTVGYAMALTQFAMTWGLGYAYLRYSQRVLDPLRERATARALAPRVRSGRFTRDEAEVA